MTQLATLKILLENPSESDDILNFYLDNASDIICEIRNTSEVELKFLNTQLKIAVELFNKRGAEGQISHSENGIARMYESSDISPSLLRLITPVATTPFSSVRGVSL